MIRDQRVMIRAVRRGVSVEQSAIMASQMVEMVSRGHAPENL
jgi:hypothetical protein